MLRPGLVSISFRALSPQEIVNLCVQSHLEGIEWGGDVHVPHGDTSMAREVAKMTRDEGLEIAAYGSYYRCDGALPFERVLESALELGAPLIRVWAGNSGSDAVDADELASVMANLYDACEMAQSAGVGIVTEYHGGTLMDTRESARETLEGVGHPNLKTLWQPLRRGAGLNAKITENVEDLRDVAPYLANVHVYEWREIEAGKMKRFSLQKSAQWPRYIEELKKIEGDRWMLLEYVTDDMEEILGREAAALRSLIDGEPVVF
jgi:3-dehydroshikimate dehydratase